MKRLLALVSSALLLSSCTTPGPVTSPPSARGPTAPPGATSRAGAYAFVRQDTPYAQVAAEAQRTGRPLLIYFWTSW